MTRILALFSLWRYWLRFRRSLKRLDRYGTSRVNDEIGKEHRLILERLSYRLRRGDVKGVPWFARLLLRLVKCDESFGRYLQALLKSEKLEKGDSALEGPLMEAYKHV